MPFDCLSYQCYIYNEVLANIFHDIVDLMYVGNSYGCFTLKFSAQQFLTIGFKAACPEEGDHIHRLH